MNFSYDEIFVQKIKAYGYHGVFEKENIKGQWFSVDLKMFLPLAEAERTDDLLNTVNYAEAALIAKSCIERRPPFRLIERLAGTIAQEILEKFPAVREIEVCVHKPDAPVSLDFEDLGVKIRRVRD